MFTLANCCRHFTAIYVFCRSRNYWNACNQEENFAHSSEMNTDYCLSLDCKACVFKSNRSKNVKFCVMWAIAKMLSNYIYVMYILLVFRFELDSCSSISDTLTLSEPHQGNVQVSSNEESWCDWQFWPWNIYPSPWKHWCWGGDSEGIITNLIS